MAKNRNRYFNSFIDGLETRFPDDSTIMPMSEWVIKNTTLRQRPFSFKDFDFQRQIVDDMHPDLSCIKLSQVGLTEVQMRKFFGFLKRNVGTSGIFAMPNQPMRDRLTQTRVKSLIESDKIFNGPMAEKPVRKKELYQVDQSFGYFTGSTESEATSIPADILFSDEVDLADQQMLALFRSRLQASKWKIVQRFSTPTYIGYGIHGAYENSDKHEYFCKCGHCNHQQIPAFERRFMQIPGLPSDLEDFSRLTAEDLSRINYDGCYVKCERCSAPLDLGNPELREWVAERPAYKSRGYRVRPFSVASITIPYILGLLVEYQQKNDIRRWYNTVLGEPFNDADARISEENIRIAMASGTPAVPNPRPSGNIFMGVDVGQTCHVVVGTENHLFEWRQVPEHELKEFIIGRIKTYGVVGGAIDRYPYTPLSNDIREATNSIIMPIAYATTPGAAPLKDVKDEFDVITHFVANRTMAVDVVARQIRNHRLSISGYGDNGTLLITHLRGMIRIEEPDSPPIWEKLGDGSDHFLHAAALQQAAVRLKAGLDFANLTEIRTGFLIKPANILQPKESFLHKKPSQTHYHLGVLG